MSSLLDSACLCCGYTPASKAAASQMLTLDRRLLTRCQFDALSSDAVYLCRRLRRSRAPPKAYSAAISTPMVTPLSRRSAKSPCFAPCGSALNPSPRVILYPADSHGRPARLTSIALCSALGASSGVQDTA